MALVEVFKCQCCGNCCRVPGVVRVSLEEADTIAAFLGIDPYQFSDQYTVLAPDRKTLIFAGDINGPCRFLTAENRCAINPVKPKQCRDYPSRWRSDAIEAVCPAGRINPSQKD